MKIKKDLNFFLLNKMIWYVILIVVMIIHFMMVKIELERPPFNNRIHIIHLPLFEINLENLAGNQNVHDSQVREKLWKKYNHLYNEVKEKYNRDDWLVIIKRNARYYLANTPFDNVMTEELIFDTDNVSHYELEIFSVVYDKFKELRLDPKIFTDMIDDCYEDNEPVCLTGRISRYISVFEGIVDGYLGESEMTDEIEFQYVLNKTKVLLDYYFEKNPRFKNIYNNCGSKEEETVADEAGDQKKKKKNYLNF